jgi:hypothetical protein
MPPTSSHTRQVTVTSSLPSHKTLEEKLLAGVDQPHTHRDNESDIQLFSLRKVMPASNTIEKIKVYRPQTASAAAMKKKLIMKPRPG